MPSLAQRNIELVIKVKHAVLMNVDEPKMLSVLWRRGKRELESKAGELNPATHEAVFDDSFRMKTTLDYDIDTKKFQENKLSILYLRFHETKQEIGHAEFNIGRYANHTSGKKVKQTLDLKSEKFPGAQLYLYVDVVLLDNLTDQGDMGKTTVQKHNPKEHRQEAAAEALGNEVVALTRQKTLREQESERLQYLLEQAAAEQKEDFLELLRIKSGFKKQIQWKLTRHGKQHSIIIQVL